MKSLFLFVFTCFISLAWGQIPAPTFRWAVPISGALDITDMKVTPAGDTYITGYFEDYICFDTTWAHCQEGLGEGTDQYIAKYNRDGVLQWAKVVGSKNSEGIGGEKFEVDDMGNVYYSSIVQSDTLIIGDTLLFTQHLIIFPLGKIAHLYMIKLSSEGKLLNSNQGNNWRASRFSTLSGSLYFAAEMNTEEDFDDTLWVGNTNVYAPETKGLFIGSINSNYELLTYKIFPIQSDISIYNIETLTDGTILLHGSFKDSLTIGDTTFVARGTSDFFLFAFNNKFQLKWAEVYDNGFDNLYSSLVPDSNSFYFFGSISASSPTLWMGDTLLPRSTPYHIAAKISSDREVAWRILTQVPGNAVCKLRNSLYMMSGGDGNAGDTLNFYDNQLIYPYDRFQSFIRLDDTLNIVWNKTIFVYDPNAPGIDRWAIPIELDTLGYLYGQGGMRQFAIYLDNLLVRPLFTAMEHDYFIFSLTRDSFLVVPPPPPDIIPLQWQIYPNPFTEVLTISGEWRAGQLSLDIYDITGRTVTTKDFLISTTGTKKLNYIPPSLSAGIYLARLYQGEVFQYIKLVKH